MITLRENVTRVASFSLVSLITRPKPNTWQDLLEHLPAEIIYHPQNQPSRGGTLGSAQFYKGRGGAGITLLSFSLSDRSRYKNTNIPDAFEKNVDLLKR